MPKHEYQCRSSLLPTQKYIWIARAITSQNKILIFNSNVKYNYGMGRKHRDEQEKHNKSPKNTHVAL